MEDLAVTMRMFLMICIIPLGLRVLLWIDDLIAAIRTRQQLRRGFEVIITNPQEERDKNNG